MTLIGAGRMFGVIISNYEMRYHNANIIRSPMTEIAVVFVLLKLTSPPILKRFEMLLIFCFDFESLSSHLMMILEREL